MIQKLQWLPAEIEAWFFSHSIEITNNFKQADGNICIETSDGLYRYDINNGELLKHRSMKTRPHWLVVNQETVKQIDLF